MRQTLMNLLVWNCQTKNHFNMSEYRKRLTEYIRTMPRGTVVETATIVKEENIELFRKEFRSICEEYWDDFGKEFTCNHEMTMIKRYSNEELAPIVPGRLTILGREISYK